MILELYDELESIAECLFGIRNDMVYGHVSVDSISIEGGDTCIATYSWYDSFREHTMSGPDMGQTETFPLSYVRDDEYGWVSRESEIVKAKKMKELKNYMEKEEQKKLKAAEAEKELFLTLKKKYEET